MNMAARPRTNAKRSDRIIAFVERYCIVPEGLLVGQPMRLDAFQKKFIRDVYDNPKKTRRGILSIARKNGKTGLIAALVLAHLVGPEAVQNSQIVSGAQSRDQAGIVYSLASKMVMLSDELRDIVHIIPSKKTLVGLPLNVEYRALSAEGKTAHGLSPVLAILDEIGQVRGSQDDFIDAITTSQGAHEAPLLLAISTQAPNDADLLSIWIDDAKRSGDPRIVCHVYAADEDADLADPKQWKKANPALGNFRSLDDIREQSQQAVRMPSAENTFRNLCLNQRVSVLATFVTPNLWRRNNKPADDEVFLTSPCFVGLDLSGKNDLTAIVMVARDEHGYWHIKPEFWAPAIGVTDRANRDRAPYDVWAKQGHLHLTESAGVEYATIAERLVDICETYPVSAIAFDRWNMDRLKSELARIYADLPLENFGQGYRDMSPAVDALETELLNEKIRHGDHPVLNMCAMNAVVLRDPAGSRKLDKGSATGRIDGMVALAMAIGQASKSLLESDSFLDDLLSVRV